MNKMENLANALNQCGIKTKIYKDIYYLCTDNKYHYGHELETELLDSEGNRICFSFSPNGDFVRDWIDNPIKEEKNNKKRKKKGSR